MKRYSFDTSAFIEPWTRHYPPRLFQPLWVRLDELGKTGTIIAARAVSWEIQSKTDELSKWLADRDHFFMEPVLEVQQRLREILRSHARLLSMAKNRSGADPWVIAQAQASAAAVVTYEQWDAKRKNIKIPEVCHDLNIKCLTFVEFMDECGLRFKLE